MRLLCLVAAPRFYHQHPVARRAGRCDDGFRETPLACVRDELDRVQGVPRHASVEDDDIDLVEVLVEHLIEFVQRGSAHCAEVETLEQQALVVADDLGEIISNQNQRFVVDGHYVASVLCVQLRAGSSISLDDSH